MSNETPAEVLAEMRRAAADARSKGHEVGAQFIEQYADRLSRALAAGKVEVDPCGGCGETNPDKRCLGCRHVFFKAPQPKAWMHLDGRVISDKEKSEMLRSEIASISGVASRFTIPLGPITAPPADPAKASEPEYDRGLIADMLEGYAKTNHMYEPYAVQEQIRLLRAADNADAAKVRTVRASGSAPGLLSEDDVQWIVNDLAELGVMIRGQAFFLYKGDSLVYADAKHEDGRPMHYRTVGKREFGECCHPINHKDYSLKGTVSLDDSDRWQLLPPAPATPPASAPEVTESMVERGAVALWERERSKGSFSAHIEWDDISPLMKAGFRAEARAALTAALQEKTNAR